MATNKMKLKRVFRLGGDDLLEKTFGIRFEDKENNSLDKEIHETLLEHEDIKKDLKEAILDTDKETEEKALLEKMEYFETLDIVQLRNMVKTTSNFPHKHIIKMKREDLIKELLK